MPLVHHPPTRKGDTHHLVSLTSTTYGSLVLNDRSDLKNPNFNSNACRVQSESPTPLTNTSQSRANQAEADAKYIERLQRYIDFLFLRVKDTKINLQTAANFTSMLTATSSAEEEVRPKTRTRARKRVVERKSGQIEEDLACGVVAAATGASSGGGSPAKDEDESKEESGGEEVRPRR
ncbi:hypothetical protein K1719_000829 [Acacia pycnantha]|nr:hypothetical protein K1719_000829 [Acacia pycnantha]